MEEALEMLKLMGYEESFCKSKGYKPFPKSYFVYASSNSSEQFLFFILYAVN